MMYLLDSNTCIAFLRSRTSPVKEALARIQASDIALCSIVVAELYEGAYRSAQQQNNLAKVGQFVAQFIVLPFDTIAAQIAGQQGARLAALGTPIGPHDLQIAAIALEHDLTLVTHNVREFSRINGLRIEDWQRDDLSITS
ncbi:twitching motility protein PilT [Kouleothrix aurantiaca]|uniref:Ribonuclease VapC n=1 Tax=Kouleothrix aurantiaca TaxID=186479 RepID=A0A0N8PT22_9CHLR|nr:twitching motility protein PilT [Kouleothrix aurantiaca]